MIEFDRNYWNNLKKSVLASIHKASEETAGWLAVVILHSATLPSMLAFSQGLSDVLLPIDMVLLLWAGLMMLFIKAALARDTLNMLTIGAGFAVQAGLLVLTFFK
jgi:hypothetical protein